MSREARADARPHAPTFRARERTVAGVVELFCNKCERWVRWDRMRKDAKCHRGRSNECNACYADRKRIRR